MVSYYNLLSMPEKQNFEFGVETKKILKLMIHSLYTNKDIVIRELVSNASDACDKLRYQSTLNPDILKKIVGLTLSGNVDLDDPSKQIVINNVTPDDEWKTNKIRDNFYIVTNLSAINVLRVIKLLLKQYNVDESEFSVSVKKQALNN